MIAVIGDVHGRVRTLERIYNRLFTRYGIDRIVLLGDLIDRGGSEREVVDLVNDVRTDAETVVLRGNHEDMMLDWIFDEGRYPPHTWIFNGGDTTINSFLGKEGGTRPDMDADDLRTRLRDAMGDHLTFYAETGLYHEIETKTDRFIAVHAGFELTNETPDEQHERAVTQKIPSPLFWIRGVDEYEERYRESVIIHGHTPVMNVAGAAHDRPYVNAPGRDTVTVNLDTGCVYGQALAAMLIDTDGGFTFEVETCRDS